MEQYDTCDDCGGTGNADPDGVVFHRCPTCNGKGWVTGNDAAQ